MKAYIISISIIVIFLFSGCNSQCEIDCSCYPEPTTVGYNHDEMDTVILKYYTPGGNFSTLVDSSAIIKNAYANYWEHTTYNGTSDTLICNRFGLEHVTLSDRHSPILDFEIIILSNNRTYKISNLKLAGPETGKVKCYHGSAPMGSTCGSHQYIISYVLDGNTINFAPFANTGYIYLKK